MQWYVLQVVSGLEPRVQTLIQEKKEVKGVGPLIAEVLVPTENVAEVKKGQQVVTEKRLWPGYVLVKAELTDDVWSFLKETNGVLSFLGGERPTPLSQKEIDEILDDLREKKEKVVQKHNLAAGDRVKIIDGVFVNFVGKVLEVFHEKGRVSVMVSIFGRETRVDDLEFWQIEVLPTDTEVS